MGATGGALSTLEARQVGSGISKRSIGGGASTSGCTAVGSCALRLEKASNTSWQRPQRTFPLETCSCCGVTLNTVSQCVQRVYMEAADKA
jgi:hypothetical protein